MVRRVAKTLFVTFLLFGALALTVKTEAKNMDLIGGDAAEKALKGNGDDHIYLRIFDGMVPLPNTYYFDTTQNDVSFKGETGRIIVGRLTEFTKSPSYSWWKSHAKESRSVCGLTVTRIPYKDTQSFLVTDNRDYMLFVDRNTDLWKAALYVYCQVKQAN